MLDRKSYRAIQGGGVIGAVRGVNELFHAAGLGGKFCLICSFMAPCGIEKPPVSVVLDATAMILCECVYVRSRVRECSNDTV